jgi:hypothetical protein
LAQRPSIERRKSGRDGLPGVVGPTLAFLIVFLLGLVVGPDPDRPGACGRDAIVY